MLCIYIYIHIHIYICSMQIECHPTRVQEVNLVWARVYSAFKMAFERIWAGPSTSARTWRLSRMPAMRHCVGPGFNRGTD